jgi:ketosteroid isomerase-like protein
MGRRLVSRPVDPALEQKIRHAYEAFGRADATRLAEFFHEDALYVNPPEAVEPGTRTGLAEIAAVWDSVFGTFEFAGVEIEELAEGSAGLLVVARYDGRGRASGAPVDFPVHHVLQLRGDRVERLQWYITRDEAAAAAGVS